MPDISMCNGNDCPLKEDCYRYKAKPSKFRQSYFFTPPYKGTDCEYFWPTNEDKNRIEPCKGHSMEDEYNT